MSEQPGPVPQRIGDTERDKAVSYLQEHLAAGRLDQMEFDERLTTALSAKTADELDPLFADLPEPKPGAELVPVSSPTGQPAGGAQVATPGTADSPALRNFRTVASIIAAIAWPAAIIIGITTGHWWFIWIAIFMPWWMGRWGHQDGHQRHERDRRG